MTKQKNNFNAEDAEIAERKKENQASFLSLKISATSAVNYFFYA
jgi:hypothetical protein